MTCQRKIGHMKRYPVAAKRKRQNNESNYNDIECIGDITRCRKFECS